jgi:hypothetical protein
MTAGASRRAVGDDGFPAWLGSVEARLDDLAQAIGRPRTFATLAARNAAFPHAKAGDTCSVAGARQHYDGTGWLQWDSVPTSRTPVITGLTSGTMSVNTGAGGHWGEHLARRGPYLKVIGYLDFAGTGDVLPTGHWLWNPPAGCNPIALTATELLRRYGGGFAYNATSAARAQVWPSHAPVGVHATFIYFETSIAICSGNASPWGWAGGHQLSWDFEYPLSATDRYV